MGEGVEFSITDDMRRIVEEQRLGFVATVCPDGSPNLSPKGTTSVWDDQHLVFADLHSPQTVRNLRQNPWAEVNVVDPFTRRGYRFKGRCRILEGKALKRGLAFFSAGPHTIERASERINHVVLVRVESASALLSPSYALGASERELQDKWTQHFASLLRSRSHDP